MRFVAFLLTILIANVSHARCHAILFQSEGSGPVIDGRFTQNLSRVYQALQSRGCPRQNIRVLVGSGSGSDPMQFPFRAITDVQDYPTPRAFRGVTVQENSTQNLQNALQQVKAAARPGDTVYIHIDGHSVSTDGTFELRDGTMAPSELKSYLREIDPGVQTRIVADFCWSGSVVDEMSNLPNICVLSSQNRDRTSTFSNRLSYTKGFATMFASREKSLLDSHWVADASDSPNNEAFSTLDLFIERTVDINEFARFEQFLSQRNLDCEQNSRSVVQELGDIFNGRADAGRDVNRLFKFAKNRTVGDMLSEYRRLKSTFNRESRVAIARTRFEAARATNNYAKMDAIEREMNRSLDEQQPAALGARIRQIRRYLGAVYIMRFGSEAEKQRLRRILDCFDTGSGI